MAVSSCAVNPVALYTLGAPPREGALGVLGRRPVVIVVDRVSLPDALDSQDMMVRHGNVLRRSHSGRWASRLSVGATDLIAELLAQGRPDALVTDEPQVTTPSFRILIDISVLDLAVDEGVGSATLQADWQIIPANAGEPGLRDRALVRMQGPVETDQDVATLMAAVLTQLAARIDVATLR